VRAGGGRFLAKSLKVDEGALVHCGQGHHAQIYPEAADIEVGVNCVTTKKRSAPTGLGLLWATVRQEWWRLVKANIRLWLIARFTVWPGPVPLQQS